MRATLLVNKYALFKEVGDSWNYMPPILASFSAKHITTQILVIAKLNGRKDLILRGFFAI